MAGHAKSAQYSNDVLEEVTGKKSLNLNNEKSSYLVLSNRKTRNELIRQLKKSPLTLNDKEMKEEKVIKC